MENAVKTQLQSVQFGEAQTYENIAILPLIAPVDGTFQYRTLGHNPNSRYRLVAPKPSEGGLDTKGKSGASAFSLQPSALAQSFLAEITAADERQYPSVGHGTDYRYRLVAPKPSEGGSPISASQLSAFQRFSLTGSALVHQNEVIHAAFFRLDDPSTINPQPSTNLASLRRRRHYRE